MNSVRGLPGCDKAGIECGPWQCIRWSTAWSTTRRNLRRQQPGQRTQRWI